MTRLTRRSLLKQFRFEQAKSPPIVVNFQGGQVTSDAPILLNC
ncbi:transposase [Nostoc sp. CHAB 5715]|nr:transposase [Nostoc sp. CHAB 5715]MCC5620416.1 transposase [Nostoc sp. CHAB 5715]